MVATSRTIGSIEAARSSRELGIAESVHDLMRAVLHRVEPTLEEENLSMGRFWALHLVANLKEPTLTTVARHLSVRNASACSAVDGLEAAGLVRRRRSDRDHRRVEIVPTARGRRAEGAVWRAIARIVREATDDLPSEDVATTARTLRALVRRVAADPSNPSDPEALT